MKKDGYIFWCSKCKVDHAGECKTEPVTCPARHVFKAGIKIFRLDDSTPRFVVSDTLVPSGEAYIRAGVVCVSAEAGAELGPTNTIVELYGFKFQGWNYGE